MSSKTQVCLHPEAWKVQEASKRGDQTYTPHSIHLGTEHWKPSWPCSPVSVSQALQPRLVHRWASVPKEDQLESRLKCHISSPEIMPAAPRPQEGGERNPDRRWAGCPRGAWGTALWAVLYWWDWITAKPRQAQRGTLVADTSDGSWTWT